MTSSLTVKRSSYWVKREIIEMQLISPTHFMKLLDLHYLSTRIGERDIVGAKS